MDIATQPDDAQQVTQLDAETSESPSESAFVEPSVAAVETFTSNNPCIQWACDSPGATSNEKTIARTKHERIRAKPNRNVVAGLGLTVPRVAIGNDSDDGFMRTCLVPFKALVHRRATIYWLTSRAQILPQPHHYARTRTCVSRSPWQFSGTPTSPYRLKLGFSRV